MTPPMSSGMNTVREKLPSFTCEPAATGMTSTCRKSDSAATKRAIEAEQQQAWDKHAAVDADGRRREAGAQGDDGREEDRRLLVRGRNDDRRGDGDERDDGQDAANGHRPGGHARPRRESIEQSGSDRRSRCVSAAFGSARGGSHSHHRSYGGRVI